MPDHEFLVRFIIRLSGGLSPAVETFNQLARSDYMQSVGYQGF